MPRTPKEPTEPKAPKAPNVPTPPSGADLPSTRIARSAKLGGLTAGQTARYAGTKAANLARTPEKRRAALERRHIETAEQILAVLGTMKGPAMKLGQMLSFMDLGLLPEEVRPRFQRRLASLADDAPHIPWARMEPVLIEAFGGPLATAFADFDHEPIGTASIGQVYRARLHDGRDVAVKVQYPKIVEAAEADLKNLAVVLRLVQSAVPGVDMGALSAELTTRFTEELDYAREAINTEEMSQAFRDHPFIHVPSAVRELCRDHVLVTEYVDGGSFGELATFAQHERDRAGEILVRFHLGSLFRLGFFSGDPHPGNVKVLADGRLAFLDFGSFRRLEPSHVGLLPEALAALMDGRVEEAVAAFAREGALADPDNVLIPALADQLADACGWFLTPGITTMTAEAASAGIMSTLVTIADRDEVLGRRQLPAEWALLIRTVVSTMALLGQLDASADWNGIACEWIRGAGPSTPLGELEAHWFTTALK